MAVIIIEDKVNTEQIVQAAEDHFGEYIKIVLDVDIGAMAIGGEWHSDAEKVLIDAGSKQKDLWGGGLRLSNKTLMLVRKFGSSDSSKIRDNGKSYI